MSDFSNEIYDPQVFKDGQMGPWTIFLGVLVTLMPKLIPRVMPTLLTNTQRNDEFFDNEKYLREAEHLFVEKFGDNLRIIERLVVAWKDDKLEPSHFGMDGIVAREDLITGEPEGFQKDLLQGIGFLKTRLNKIEDRQNGYEGDQITQIADIVWSLFSTISRFMF